MSTADERGACAKRIFSGEPWDRGGHPCPRRGTVKEDGQWWCKQHAPSHVAARWASLDAKRVQRDAEADTWRAERERAAFAAELRRRVAAMEAKPVNFWPDPDAAVYVGEVLVSRAALLRALGVSDA